MKSSKEVILEIDGLKITSEMIDALDLTASGAKTEPSKLHQALKDPTLFVYRDLLLFLKKNEGKPVILSEKDADNYKQQIPASLAFLNKTHPNLTLQDALARILQEMPAVYSEKLLLELVKFIGKQWQTIKSEEVEMA